MRAIYIGQIGNLWLVVHYEDRRARVIRSSWSEEGATKEAKEFAPKRLGDAYSLVDVIGLPQTVIDAGQERQLDAPPSRAWVANTLR